MEDSQLVIATCIICPEKINEVAEQQHTFAKLSMSRSLTLLDWRDHLMIV